MRRIAPLSLIVFIAVFGGGCGNKEKTGDMKNAVNDFNSGRYAQSRDAANEAMANSKGTAKDEAAYLAGLSAYQLGDTDEAERRWVVSANSSNVETAANSKAMLGQLKLDQHHPREAAELLAEASQNMQGDDAQQAAKRAAIAYQQAGDQANANKWFAIAGQPENVVSSPAKAQASASSTTATTPKMTPPSAASPNGYALQVGAFNELSRARRAAEDADRLAKKQGIGPVKMFSKHDDRGRKFFIVQLGYFTTRDEATSARSKLGKLEYIVAPAAAKVDGYASAG